MASPTSRADEVSSCDSKLKNVLENLECPVCFERYTCPVFMCSTGHGVCGNCKDVKEVQECPICMAPMTERRNFDVERIIETCFANNDDDAKKKRYITKLKNVQNAILAEAEKRFSKDDTEYITLAKENEAIREKLKLQEENLTVKNTETEQLSAKIEDLTLKLKQTDERYAKAEFEVKTIKEKLEIIVNGAMEILFGDSVENVDVPQDTTPSS